MASWMTKKIRRDPSNARLVHQCPRSFCATRNGQRRVPTRTVHTYKNVLRESTGVTCQKVWHFAVSLHSPLFRQVTVCSDEESAPGDRQLLLPSYDAASSLPVTICFGPGKTVTADANTNATILTNGKAQKQMNLCWDKRKRGDEKRFKSKYNTQTQ